jgi:hypothetical protein
MLFDKCLPFLITFPYHSPSAMRRFVLILLFAAFTLPASAQLGGSSSSASFDERVKTALDQEGWSYEIDEDGDFKMIVNFSSEGRTQLVWVISRTLEAQGMEVREVWSPVYNSASGEIPSDIAMWGLERSWDQIIGSLATDGQGTVYFVAKVDADAPAEVLSKVIRVAASTGDELEKEKSSGDKL